MQLFAMECLMSTNQAAMESSGNAKATSSWLVPFIIWLRNANLIISICSRFGTVNLKCHDNDFLTQLPLSPHLLISLWGNFPQQYQMEFTFFSLQFPREYSMGCISSDFVLNLELILYNQALCCINFLVLAPIAWQFQGQHYGEFSGDLQGHRERRTHHLIYTFPSGSHISVPTRESSAHTTPEIFLLSLKYYNIIYTTCFDSFLN